MIIKVKKWYFVIFYEYEDVHVMPRSGALADQLEFRTILLCDSMK